PVPEDNQFHDALEMLRLAPSDTNTQPWRALVDGNTVHFYYKPKSPAAVLDLGIGICHFYETEKFNGRNGDFFKINNVPIPPENWKYLISYTSDK
ncbi:MAG: hypothetical protein K2N08_08850, partial [Muribaculaceae bacterium]|nr:hypothetical protein [Muribaculaceae bacterium]